jgi:hypothetical protein
MRPSRLDGDCPTFCSKIPIFKVGSTIVETDRFIVSVRPADTNGTEHRFPVVINRRYPRPTDHSLFRDTRLHAVPKLRPFFGMPVGEDDFDIAHEVIGSGIP